MRAAWVGLMLVAASGCVTPMTTVTTSTTRRAALAPVPSSPLALAGAAGVSLGARAPLGEPVSTARGGGVALPGVQPELGAVLQFGERTWLGLRTDFATSALGLRAPPGGPTFRGNELSLDISVGVAHELPFNEHFGLLLAADLGVRATAVVIDPSLDGPQVDLGPTTRGAAGVSARFRQLRFFLAAAGSTIPWNDATGSVTQTCNLTCSEVQVGRVATTGLFMAGAGLTWQPSPTFNFSVELWVPLAAESVRMPPLLSATVRVGDFVIGRPRPRPEPASPPPPPPPLVPAEVEPPPQL